jgi:hypothetical protein
MMDMLTADAYADTRQRIPTVYGQAYITYKAHPSAGMAFFQWIAEEY